MDVGNLVAARANIWALQLPPAGDTGGAVGAVCGCVGSSGVSGASEGRGRECGLSGGCAW